LQAENVAHVQTEESTVESDIWLATEVCEAFMVFAGTAPTGPFQVPAAKLAVGNLAV
jgi:hypothetical protein